jgi:deoxyribodipyrimidine photo-lyase
MQEISIHWFRRDLRLNDNAALYHALQSGFPVIPIFIFDTNILDELKETEQFTEDRRVQFIYTEIIRLKKELNELDSDLLVYYGKPLDIWKDIVKNYPVKSVFTNHDYEPYARERDKEISDLLRQKNISLKTYKDQVIFEKDEVVKNDGTPYTVFTPYSRKWKEKLNSFYVSSYPTENYFPDFFKVKEVSQMIPLEKMGFKKTSISFPSMEINEEAILKYPETRDLPAIKGTSRLSVHLRFGTVSIRKLVRETENLKSERFLNELIWREFYMMILWHFPRVINHSFREEYDRIEWRNNEKEFDAWCNGMTGYPIVDAGMRELNATGFMHNRVRMITASFLTKHLLIDWRWGEAYFAKKLLDYELSSNNGGWQWAAGSGADAAPYFRIFNPYTQALKFDKNLAYINRWIPALNTLDYPAPIVEHTFARERCLQIFSTAIKKPG